MRPAALWIPLLLLATSLPAQEAAPPPAPQPIPRETLEQMYRREMSDFYRPALSDQFHQAHFLIEKYFTVRLSERKQVAAQIQAVGLDPNVIGRLSRIRMYWPDLKGGVYYINEKVGPHQVLYFLGVPNSYDRARAMPLVIKLPTAHAFVTDPPPSPEQVQQIYTQWMQEELKVHPDALCIMPLLNLQELWGPSYPGMNAAIQPLFHAYSRVNIDPKRVYLVGHGMSGHAVWNLAVHYPTYFAAINPMSGGMVAPFQMLRLPNLRNTYSVVWHDAEDPLIKVDYSRNIVKVLRGFNYDVDYEETKGVGHAPSEAIADRLYAKMRARTRELYPREVVLASNRPDTLFNRNDWMQVYQMLTPGGEEAVRFQHGSGSARMNQNSYRLAATLQPNNRIDIRSDNVESMRIYLNDQMVDLTKPVTVYVNRVQRFQGMVKLDINEMLADEGFVGRGWRYYSGYVDIDFGVILSRPSTRPTTRKGIIEYTPPRD